MSESKLKGDFIITVPKGRGDDDGVYTFGVTDPMRDEPAFIYAQKLFREGKENDCVRYIMSKICVDGDSVEEFSKNLYAIRSAVNPILELLVAGEATIKKN